MPELERTPLFNFHVAHGGRMVPFAGWEMPVQYTGIIEEHLAVRRAAGLFDVSHMGECRVSGPDAATFLDRVMTQVMSTIPIGMARYTIMCQPDGGCVDDLIVYRLDAETFLICLNASNAAKDIAWLRQQAGTDRVTIVDECRDWAQLALQGPLAEAILAGLTSANLAALKRFGFVTTTVAGCAGCLVSRTGYTGSAGFEIYLPATHATQVAEAIWHIGKPQGLLLAGLGCRDSLRLEAGYPLYGHEISETLSPIQAGLGWAVKFTKPAFVGRDALKRQADGALTEKVVAFSLNDRRIARQGTAVLSGTQQVGQVLSGTLSPLLNKPIGTALVSLDALNQGQLEVDLRGNRVPLIISSEPFYK